MVKNFVGREKERPEIRAEDLRESENELKSRLLSEKYPYSIGLPCSEFVKISLSLVDLMSDPKELNKPEKPQPMFVKPCISMNSTSFPCLPPTRRNCFALSILNRNLFYPENLYKQIFKNEEEEEESNEDNRNYEEEFENDFTDFEKLDEESFEEIKKKWESTDELPNFDIKELKYLNIEDLKESKEFSILNSSFISLFSHSLLRVMQTTKQLKPEVLESNKKSNQPPNIPFYKTGGSTSTSNRITNKGDGNSNYRDDQDDVSPICSGNNEKEKKRKNREETTATPILRTSKRKKK